MTYDLRREPWIPWRMRSGAVVWGPPAMLMRGIGAGEDVVVSLASPRADFDGALQEFLIGLLAAAIAPADERAWRQLWRTPPTEDELQAALDRLPDAFDLDGDGPRFMQDLTALDFVDVTPNAIEQLLIDTPGENGVKKNTDLFVKRRRAARLCRPAAAMALITMQTYAPAGGVGHRTSMRGGGPLTTLVDPRKDDGTAIGADNQPLWYKLWANVETEEQLHQRTPAGRPRDAASLFPWLAPTRTSDGKKGGRPVQPTGAHPLQAYFGQPRRIRLDLAEGGACDLTGQADTRCVIGFRAINYGVEYDSWKHPLSPHYRKKVTEPWLPVHGQPSGVTWRDWVSLSLARPDTAGLREPAAVVAAFSRRAVDLDLPPARLHAFGFDMDNMKARGWVDATLPLHFCSDEDQLALLISVANGCVEATGMASSALRDAVKSARFQKPDEARGDFTAVQSELWAQTEAPFFATLGSLTLSGSAPASSIVDAETARVRFAGVLRGVVFDVFDRWCSPIGIAPEALRRRVFARHALRATVTGYSKSGEKLYAALGIAPPGGGMVTRKMTRKSTTSSTGGT